MIKINIVRDNKGFIWEFKIKGHAGFSNSGEDIICAAISAIAYTALGGLDELVGIKNYKEKDGYIRCSIPVDIATHQMEKVKIILETMVIGFRQIEMAYRDYVVVLDEEV